MNFSYAVNTDIEVPLYTQLVDMIKADVRAGRLPFGEKLPTVRELSDSCGIARGTVMRAYDELESLGIIEKIQGRGTFVCQRDENVSSRKDRAMEAIDTMLDTLEGLNFSRSEINIYLNLKLQERSEDETTVNIGVVETCREMLDRACAGMRALPEISIYPYLISDVLAYPYKLGDELDAIAVPAEYFQEISRLVPEDKPVFPMAERARASSIASLAGIPAGSRVGVVAKDRAFGEKLDSALASYAPDPSIAGPFSLTGDAETLKNYLKGKKYIVAPAEWENYCTSAETEAMNLFKGTLIAYEYRIDDGSMLYIGEKIEEIRKKKKG